MSIETDATERAKARDMVGKALIPENRAGGIAGAFDQLEVRLRQPYARALTLDDLNDIRSYLTARMDTILELLTPRAPEQVWSDGNSEAEPA